MTLLWIDGFEGYGSQSAAQQAYPLGFPAALRPGEGRGGGTAVFGTFIFGPPTGTTRLIIGYAAKAIPGAGPQVDWRNATNGAPYATFGVDAVGRPYLNDHNSNTFAGGIVDPGMRLPGVYRYYEHDFKLHASAGIYTLRVDGQELMALTGLNTLGGLPGLDELTKITLAGACEDFDDFYVADDQSTGDGITTFRGDRRMSIIVPNGAVTAAWTPSTAVANYLKVNETANDGDSGYVSATVVATEDKHDFQNTGLPGSQEVVCALMTSARRLAESAPREVTTFFDCGGHRLEGGSPQGGILELSEDYYIEQLRMVKHPFTGVNLVASDIDAARAGYRLTV